ncbi:antibiotic biosynthesis monooxygenase (ABM) superfamily enzyme [Microbacterium resistens]|uniref:Antibiotic biosynthesis monooxygenase (ABM) superfamily enzyme n=1 Tax=Microbacterium resistens TaxID=156977 RepID=A0ABU1SCW1_9MICO|nr:hypothetical protein [Microbacterium resistens]MDR6867426.1 antibiotic biosynthesis monooxygenase (ABM) superfamily enzyme [Microbacterium resistens]
MSNDTRPTGMKPPSQHELALMIWLAVAPTLLIINIVLGPLLADVQVVPRTLIMVTIAVPIVVYGLMPLLHRLRRRIHARRAARS